ncbi:MAG: tRNA (adenosine(37)-N6)-dimethylallyltransferase MiaA [Phycisphaerae bacterium]|nr:tRNA (adenosine(37)-N6)-dimethylallyltransferase MiaA [Phycisphaerae bacterium]
MTHTQANLIVVLGPTATGKTRFAALLAHAIHGEIISADSRQVYRHMDLGTGKDYQDYRVEGQAVPVHLIDICEPGEKYHVHAFQKDFYAAFDSIRAQGHMPILCGGTGMYIEAVTRGYQLPEVPHNEVLREQLKDKTLAELQVILAGYKTLHNRSDTDTRERALRAIEIQVCESHPVEASSRPEIRPFYLGLQLERALCRQRIAARLQQRLDAGMVEEVQGLLDRGIAPEDLIYYGLEYKFITQYLAGDMDYKTMVEKLHIAICQFSKRQMTWFRRMERHGTIIHWIDALLSDDDKVNRAIQMTKH